MVAAAEFKVAKLVQDQHTCNAQATAAAEASANVSDLIEYMEQAVEEVNDQSTLQQERSNFWLNCAH